MTRLARIYRHHHGISWKPPTATTSACVRRASTKRKLANCQTVALSSPCALAKSR